VSVPVRPPGLVTVRWFGMSDTTKEFSGIRLDDALCQAVRTWFPSNEAPDRFVLPVVIERDGKRMTDEEAEAYVRKEFAVKRATRT